MEVYANHHPDFITTTCFEWRPVLEDDRFKDIIIESLQFLSDENRVMVKAKDRKHQVWERNSLSVPL